MPSRNIDKRLQMLPKWTGSSKSKFTVRHSTSTNFIGKSFVTEGALVSQADSKLPFNKLTVFMSM